MTLHLLFGAAFFGASVQALAFPGPRPTDAFPALPQDGWTPRPTPEPYAPALLRRQNDLPLTYLLAPDGTCGFINGSPKSAYACGDGVQCAFIPASGKVPGAGGCCKGDQCAFRVSCIDNSKIDNCDDNCQANVMTLKCTDSAKFCNTVSYAGGITDYFCSTKKASGVLKAQTALNGDKTRSLSTVEPSTSSSLSGSSSSSTSSQSSSSSSSSDSSSSISTSDSSPSSSESSKSSSSSTDPSTTASAATGTAAAAAATSLSAATTPAGPIVGGVIGGIAAIALIFLGAVFFVRHKRKNSMAAGPPPASFMSEPSIPPAASFVQQQQPPASSHGSAYAPSSTHAPAPAPAPASAVAGTPAHLFAALPASDPFDPQSSSNTHLTDPSPLSTPTSSPQPSQYQQQPQQHQQQYHQPPPQYQPQQQQYNQPPRQHQPRAPPPLVPPSYYNRQTTPPSSRGGSLGDERDTATPVSAYNGTVPAAPASALGPMPGEAGSGFNNGGSQRGGGGGGDMAGVPLALQPGMGYRPYRPGSAAPGTGTGRAQVVAAGGNKTGGQGQEQGRGGLRVVTASPAPVAGQIQHHGATSTSTSGAAC